jgi:hypothetical protein
VNAHGCFGRGGHENGMMPDSEKEQAENGVVGRSEPGKFLDNQ